MISTASSRRRKVRYSSTKMTSNVKGTTTRNFALARSRYSNCPAQDHRVTGGQLHFARHTGPHVLHDGLKIAAAQVDVDPAREARVLTA